jgi:Fe-S cluster assembly scaffold protein SufB
MQQRGIDIDTARQLLMAAFASEVVSKIPIARLREELSVQLTNVED